MESLLIIAYYVLEEYWQTSRVKDSQQIILLWKLATTGPHTHLPPLIHDEKTKFAKRTLFLVRCNEGCFFNVCISYPAIRKLMMKIY